MLIAIPIGYFVAIILLVSGVYSGVDFLQNRPENAIGPEVLHELVVRSWPVIAGSALLLLIQIAKQLEKLRLVAHYVPAATTAPIKKKKKQAEAEPAAPNLADLARTTAAVSEGVAVTPMYPNSPIPGGGRVPQTTPTAAAEPPASPAVPAASARRTPGKSKAPGLSYFKVD